MSVTAVVAELRRAHRLLDEAHRATMRADTAIDQATAIFAETTRGSIWPQVARANEHGARAAQAVRRAATGIRDAQARIDEYCRNIAGHGILEETGGGSGTSTVMADDPIAVAPVTTSTRDQSLQDWISDRVNDGTITDTEDIVRIERLPDGRVIWTTKGNLKGGHDHILSSDRVDQFRRMHVAEERILDLIFTALAAGKVIGYSGEDRPVFEVDFENEKRRVAITVTREGLLIGAHPVSRKRRLRPDRYRRKDS